MPTAQQIAVQVARAYALTDILPLRHDNVQEALRSAAGALSDGRLELELRDGAVWADGERLDGGDPLDDLARGLARCGIERLCLGPRLERRALGSLLDTVRIASISGHLENLREMVAFHRDAVEVAFGAPKETQSALGQSAGAIFAGALGARDGPGADAGPGRRAGPAEASPPDHRPETAHGERPGSGEQDGIRPAGGGDGELPDSTDWDPPGSGDVTGGGGHHVSAADPQHEKRTARQGALSIEEFRKGVTLFLGGSPAQRRGWVGSLKGQAARVDVDADPSGALALLGTLLGEAGDEGDDVVYDVARELVSPSVARALVRRLAEASDEEERGEWLGLATSLGSAAASAFAEELTAPEASASQRAFIHALSLLGVDARPSIEKMLDRSEWYVVRNALAVLAAIGDEGAAELVEPKVRHPEARVRSEALMTLAAVGAERSGRVVMDVLDDEDPDVRATAAMVAGSLKVAGAAPTLRRRLEEEDNLTVVIEVLRALGSLGDEEAVEAIRRTAEPSFFSRPSKPIRVAAYRALSRIGTPEAAAILEDAADDRDPEIRAVVRQALEALA